MKVEPSPLRVRRLLRGLRLRDVAEATGINDVILSRLERGELPLLGRRLERIAVFYNERPEALRREMEKYLQNAWTPAPRAEASDA